MKCPLSFRSRTLSLLLLAVLGASMPGCSGEQTPAKDPPVAPSAQDDRIHIDRDPLGTPYIYAPDLTSAAYGLGYAVAQDHAEALVRLYLAARGRLSEFLGSGAGNRYLYHDMTMLGLQVPEVSVALYPETPQDFRDYLEAYAAGVNRYLDESRDDPALMWIGDYSISGVDVFAVDRMRIVSNQFAYSQAEMARYGQTKCPNYVYEDLSKASNAWAVAAPVASPGQTILSGDPHLPWHLDTRAQVETALDTRFWYEMHINASGARMGGGIQLGEPMPGVGYTRNAAFTGTHSGADYADAYHLERTAALTYLLGEDELEMTSRQYEIEVLGEASPVPFTMYDSVLGPVLCLWANGSIDLPCSASSRAFAFVLPSIDHEGSLPTRWAIGKSETMDQIIDALREQPMDEGNLIVATRDGQILYHLAARIPKREPDLCYGLPLESTDGPRHSWDNDGQLVLAPFEDHPLIRNPGTGYVVNNNVAPQSSTAGIDGEDLAWHNGLFNPTATGVGGYRQMLAREFFDSAGEGTVDAQASMALAMGTEVYAWRAFGPILEAVVASYPEILDDPVAAAAIEVLQDWNGTVSADSTAALVFVGWAQRLDRAEGASRISYSSPPDAAELTANQLTAARDALVRPSAGAGTDCTTGVIPYLSEGGLDGYPTAQGALVPWGDVHQLVLPGESSEMGRPLASGDKFLQTLYMSNASTSCPDFGIGSGEGGSSIMLHVTFTPDLHVRLVKPKGNLTDPADPRYGAMSDLYSSQQYREVVLEGPSEDALILDPE